MEYLQIKNGEALQINTQGNVEWDATHYCPASALTLEEAMLFDVHCLMATEHPVFDPSTHKCYRDGAEFVENKWRYKWVIVTLTAEEITAKLQSRKVQTLAQINNDDNRIYADVVGNKTTEYLKAAEDARAYKAAGYPKDEVPDYVQSWADAKRWTARQACDDILLQEMMWQGAAKLIRDYRLKAKEAVKRATTITEVETAMLIWNGFVNNIRTQLGV